jgi:hypothetical protein
MSDRRKPRAPRKPRKETFADLAAALADRTRPAAGQMLWFPPATEWDEFGFNTTTGEAGFDTDDPIRIALPPGRPRSR